MIPLSTPIKGGRRGVGGKKILMQTAEWADLPRE